MKKFLLLLSMVLFIGCNNNTKKEIVTLHNLSYEFNEKITIKEIIEKNNDTTINNEEFLNTSELGDHKVKVTADKIYHINYTVVDTTPPIIFNAQNYTTAINEDINILEKIMCGDNYDRLLKCEIVGEYDVYTLGEYNLTIKATDNSNNITEKEITLHVINPKNIEANTYKYPIEDFINNYKNEHTLIGIDVSAWQGNIDWQKVKAAGVDFAMLRIGYGEIIGKGMVIDKTFTKNLENAKKNNIKVGVYFYSYATSEKETIKQVDWIIKTLNKEKLDLPIAFDWETWANFNSLQLNFTDLNNFAKIFMDRITKNGYQAMLYGSANYLKYIWNNNEYPTWLAHYVDETDYEKDYLMWQVSSNGQVNGINGNVDLNVLYLENN